MPIGLRRVIFASFIAVFLIVAPLLVLYSMGYRYHPGKHRIERTGLIIISGEPEDATVLVDGVLRARQLPARIGGLGANEYTIRIERPGFHSWERRMTVEAGRTTLVTDLVLFRDAEPTQLLAGAIAYAAPSADGQWLAFVRERDGFIEYWLLDLRTGARTLLVRAGGAFPPPAPDAPPLTWSPRGAALLLRTPTDTLSIAPLAPREPRSLRAILGAQPSRAQWELGSDNAVIAVANGRIARIYLATQRAVVLPFAPPAGAFGVARTALYTTALRSDGAGVALLASPTDGGASTTVTVLPAGTNIAAFTDLRGTTLVLETRTPRQALTVATTDGSIAVRAGYDVERHPRDEHAVVWTTDAHELWVERDAHTPPRLILRRDAPLVRARWHPTAPTVLFATHTEVSAVELDAPPPSTPTLLAQFDVVRDIAHTTDGDALIVSGRRAGADGLFTLPLK